MGCRICYDRKKNVAIFYCTVSDTPFGPIMSGSPKTTAYTVAMAFWEYLDDDPRVWNDDGELQDAWERFSSEGSLLGEKLHKEWVEYQRRNRR